MKSAVLTALLITLFSYSYGQFCPSVGTYSSNTDLEFGDDSDTETCQVSGTLSIASNKHPDIILTNSGKFIVGDGYVNGSSGVTRETIGDLNLDGSTSIDMDTEDSLIVWGDLMQNSNSDLSITSGTLYVYGDMEITGNATFGAAGNVIIRGNFTNSSPGSNNPLTIAGGFSVGGTANLGDENVTVEDGAVFKATDLTSSGTLTIAEGGTVYVADDIDNGITVVNNNTSGTDNDCTDNCCGQYCDGSSDELSSEGESVLPITLASFSAVQEKNSVNLLWETLSEDDFSHFEVYKISNTDKKLICEVPSTLNNNGDNYTYTDMNPQLGLNIYQLRSVDFDGYTEWFTPISIVFQPTEVSFQIYPNAGVPEDLRTDIYEDFTLEVFNMAGARVMVTKVKNKDLNAVRSLPQGNYVFRYNINGHLVNQRMIIR
jgi:hypothetical protein